MAANYWDSTQRKFWTFGRSQLTDMRQKLEEQNRALVQQYPLPDRRLLHIYFYQLMNKVARPGKMNTGGIRHQVLATAQVYVRRFYAKVEIRRTNPYLVVATAMYLASKMEESPQHIRMLVAEASKLWGPDLLTNDVSKLGECEFSLISEMNSQLIIHHPYRSLQDLQPTFPLSNEEFALANAVIHDHYLTDLPLLYPPHVIAVTAVVLSVALRLQGGNVTQPHAAGVSSALQSLNAGNHNSNSSTTSNGSSSGGAGGGGGGGSGSSSSPRMAKLIDFLAESTIDIAAVVDATQELISLYEVWENFQEKNCKEQIARFVKARGLDK